MASEKRNLISIPEPKGLPYIGNVLEFRSEVSLHDLDRLHKTYGDIYRLRFPGLGSCVMVGSQKLVNELCDEKRFKKSIQAEVAEARLATGDGLFTARIEEPNWGVAHRVLMPAFGPVSIQGMFDEMYDIVTQMALKWARFGPSNPIPASEDFTRLTLDTLALCSMGYRFNSFYNDELHPFVKSMGESLVELGNRTQRPKWANVFFLLSERKLRKDIDLMRKTSNELLQARKAHPNGGNRKDLLHAMLEGVDPKTGQKLSDESIINNLVTFLVAGHETTSGTLSFAFYSLLKNPETYKKAQEEVDLVIGLEPVTVERLSKLKYIAAVLRETLRQCSPIPGITLEAYEDTVLDGRYPVKKGEPIAAIFSRSHLDPTVFGDDAEQFKPERMLDENFDRLQKQFPNCWKPFGNGMRACIGRPFAWQEMLLAMAILLQNFDFSLHDPSYTLKISETLTIKPKEFFMRASLRRNMTPLDLEHNLRGENSAKAAVTDKSNPQHDSTINSLSAIPLSIYYGSNSGTCEALARRLASNASHHGFRVAVVNPIDLAKHEIRPNNPVILFISSYEGQPPDNAKDFVAWIQSFVGNETNGIAYAVFGAGNSEWLQTFHKIPRLIDRKLTEHGGERLVPLGLTDVAKKNPFHDLELWEDNTLWPGLESKYSIAKKDERHDKMKLTIEVSRTRSSILRQDVKEALVVTAKNLTKSDMPAKRHIEIRLPEGQTYEVGDYLAVLPFNPRETVVRVLRRFQLPGDALLNIRGESGILLPTNNPISAVDLLSFFVELTVPATRKDVQVLSAHSPDEKTQHELRLLAGEELYDQEIAANRISVLDLLEKYPTIELPFEMFLGMLCSIRIRQYSISSSPLQDPRRVSLTYSVINQATLGGQHRHIGVASNYLASLGPGDRLNVAVRPSTFFRRLNDSEVTPVICVAAGSGLAPFRGLIQQRAAHIRRKQYLPPALLFYGCRGVGDDIYRDEFDTWEAEGAVTTIRAYSWYKEDTAGCKYVQNRLVEQKEAFLRLWDDGANLFVCGGREMCRAVEVACIEIFRESNGMTKEEGQKLFYESRNKRVFIDSFS